MLVCSPHLWKTSLASREEGLAPSASSTFCLDHAVLEARYEYAWSDPSLHCTLLHCHTWVERECDFAGMKPSPVIPNKSPPQNKFFGGRSLKTARPTAIVLAAFNTHPEAREVTTEARKPTEASQVR